MVSAKSTAERTSECPVGPLIIFTDRTQARQPLVDVIAAAVDGGAHLIVLREKDLPDGERAALVALLHMVLAPAGGRLLLAGRVPGPHGVHLAAADPAPAPRPAGVVGRSCHHAAELTGAAAEGVDYATVSPVFESESKPGYGPRLGVSFFAQTLALPTYALGGVDTPAKAYACVRAGAAGVAVMGAVMRAADPRRVTADLLRAMA